MAILIKGLRHKDEYLDHSQTARQGCSGCFQTKGENHEFEALRKSVYYIARYV